MEFLASLPAGQFIRVKGREAISGKILFPQHDLPFFKKKKKIGRDSNRIEIAGRPLRVYRLNFLMILHQKVYLALN